MAVFQPQNVNLAPFYEIIQRSKEKEGEARAMQAKAKLAPFQGLADAVQKIGNTYLMKEIDKKYEDRNKMSIGTEQAIQYADSLGMNGREKSEFVKKVVGLKISPDEGMKILQTAHEKIGQDKAFNEYLNTLPETERAKATAAFKISPKETVSAMLKPEKVGQKISISDKTSSTGLRWGLITNEGIKPTEYEAPKSSSIGRPQYRLDPMTGLIVPVSEIRSPEPTGEGGNITQRKQLNPVEKKTLDENEKKFREDTKELREQLNVASQMKEFTTTNPRAGIGAIQRQLARFFGEVRVTDLDAKAFSGSPDLYTKFLDLKAKYTEGKYSDVTAKDLRFLVDLADRVKRERIKEMVANYVGRAKEDIPNADDVFLQKNIAGTIYSDIYGGSKKPITVNSKEEYDKQPSGTLLKWGDKEFTKQ